MARRAVATEIERFPEADRQGDFPHPRSTDILIGHHAARLEIASGFDTGRMHHAWMLTGPEGIGKATLAYKAAIYGLASAAERQDGLVVAEGSIAARQVIQLSHPGLLVIRRAYDIKAKRFPTSISVDEVRRLRGFLNHKAEPGQWRIVIVDRADELNVNAANALLKSLEEPPQRTIFFLIAIEPGRLLPTVRSRCRLLPLEPLDDSATMAAAEQAFSAVDQTGVNEPDWLGLTSAANGSVGRLLALAAPNGQEIANSIEQLLQTLHRPDWQKWHGLADKLAPAQAQADYELFFTLLHEKIARLIKARAGGGAGDTENKMAMQLIRDGRLASWAELWETLHREKIQIQALNLDRASFLIDVFARMARTASQ